MRSLANVTTADQYTASKTIEMPSIVRVSFQVSGAAIRYQLGHGYPGVVYGGDEPFMQPLVRSLPARCTGIRIRSAVAGAPAQVSLDAFAPEDVGQ